MFLTYVDTMKVLIRNSQILETNFLIFIPFYALLEKKIYKKKKYYILNNWIDDFYKYISVKLRKIWKVFRKLDGIVHTSHNLHPPIKNTKQFWPEWKIPLVFCFSYWAHCTGPNSVLRFNLTNSSTRRPYSHSQPRAEIISSQSRLAGSVFRQSEESV